MEEFPRRISIEGNIGSGKTTLTTALGKYLSYPTIFEEFHENPFLPKFFDGHSDYAFEMETWFLMERYEQLKEWTAKEKWVSDYAFCKSEVYASNNLNSEEMQLFSRIQSALFSDQVLPDCIVYLSVSPDTAKSRIIQRGRKFEQETPISYLEEIDSRYKAFLQEQYPKLFLPINMEEFDLIKHPNQIEELHNRIKEGYKKKQHR